MVQLYSNSTAELSLLLLMLVVVVMAGTWWALFGEA